MSTDNQSATTTENEAATESFLDRAISATSKTSPDITKDLLTSLTQQAMSGTVTWNKNLTNTVETALATLDEKMSTQLTQVFHHSSFQKLEGSWLGLQKLVRNSELGAQLKIRVLDINTEELLDQFESAPAIDRSTFFNIVYQKEFGTAGGQPYGVLLGDYTFDHSDESVALLRYMGTVAASAHAPFIAAVNPNLFSFDSFQQFNEGRPVAAGFDSPQYASWNAFRNSDDARYVTLTMPRILSRLPYGADTSPVKAFAYEEFPAGADGQRRPSSEDDFTWSNAAYEMGLLMTNAFSEYGWCTAIRGLENGGQVENLPNYTYVSPEGDRIQQCPCEVNLTDEREKELSDLGLLPLVHYKNSNFGVFMGGQTLNEPKTYVDPDATSNAAISARLPYIMASSRIAHYLKVIGRDKLGSSMEADDLQNYLTTWISPYVNANAIGNDSRAKTPLCEAKVSVVEQAGRPGCYSAVVHLRPWLQLEELTTSLRMVANIPS
ncbi:MAG: type VI secretion system contractile sheath large subunit [Endozoicomonas sp. (ex Botrylloides leachii)]|nr:type VI secretion system contractile sheath large subunit [Endozoicomonas sp. (ex Botrylloides leachii)]